MQQHSSEQMDMTEFNTVEAVEGIDVTGSNVVTATETATSSLLMMNLALTTLEVTLILDSFNRQLL